MNIRPSASSPKAGPNSTVADPREELKAFVLAVHVMKMYAASEGLAVPEQARERIAALVPIEAALVADSSGRVRSEAIDADAVVGTPLGLQGALHLAMEVHADLLMVVAPATPASISYTEAPTTFRDFARRQWLICFLIVVALLAVTGLIASMVWKGQLAEVDGRSHSVRSSIASFEKRLADIEPLKKEPESFAPNLATIVIDLEQRNDQIKLGLGTGSTSVVDWPDDEIVLALTDMADQNATTQAAVVRIQGAIAGFRDRHKFEAGGSSLRVAVCDQLLNFCAALLGAAFFALYTANRYIVMRTFDRAYTTQYIVRLALGIVAGTILANFGQYMLKDKAATATTEGALILTQTLLALVGGYAADAVNSILTRVSDTMQTLVVGKQPAKDDGGKTAATSKP